MTDNKAIAMLREANPVSAEELERALSAEERSAARERAIRMGEQGAFELERGRRGSRRRRSRLRPVIALATATAVLAAIAAILLVAGSSGPGVSAAAAEALRQQARIAAGRPAFPPPGPGQYLYSKSREVLLLERNTPDGGYYDYRDPLTRESWLGADGSGRIRSVAGRVTFPSAEDRAAWRADGSPDLADGGICSQAVCDEWSDHGTRYQDLSVVPTDPAKLRKLIEERKLEGGPPGDAETFVIIGDLLRETYAPPKLRAALYRVASELPGVELLGTVRDEAGRKGTAVGYVVRGQREELIFDPKTSAVLGERYVVVDPETAYPGDPSSYPPGTVTQTKTFLDSAVVDSRSVRPSE